ncbi:MAG: DUF1003 domain-containing protein [Gemmatimonadota bacterium]
MRKDDPSIPLDEGNAKPAAAERAHETTPGSLAKRMLRAEWGALSTDERAIIEAVLTRVTSGKVVARDINKELRESRTLGERWSDQIANFGGSWTFILLFLGFLAFWTLLNTEILGPRHDAFDPYPFIFLNLLLSMVAALQAPVIMMSQNRAAKRDRIEAKNDYQVNLKAELEIRELHDKLDALREAQWTELVRMQHDQIRLLERVLTGERGSQEAP